MKNEPNIFSDPPEESESQTSAGSSNRHSELKEAYNLVSDTVVGVNVRKSDNVFQMKFTFVATLIVAIMGAVATGANPSWQLPWYGGALIGGFAGMVLGVFASGIFLMIYRVIRHVHGHHD
ncbi:hypothetical protein DTL42_22640 [Bremerella cremea]|uniref:Uncharacterized protein n=1 Tax=Bremerella cremea TaxID=1031537 RepID=A0A368KKR2_9BACT|nr:hypothetical protein [Bremerella cremea]RCS41361.1 hypothetical protein DTL42_22640 [Bremerella cremea]